MSELEDYIKSHKGLKDAVDAMVSASKEAFPNQPQYLSLYHDPESEDSWVLLTVVFGAYPDDIGMRLRQVKQNFLPLLEKSEGWCSVVVTHKL